jgi:hypothetical protein
LTVIELMPPLVLGFAKVLHVGRSHMLPSDSASLCRLDPGQASYGDDLLGVLFSYGRVFVVKCLALLVVFVPGLGLKLAVLANKFMFVARVVEHEAHSTRLHPSHQHTRLPRTHRQSFATLRTLVVQVFERMLFAVNKFSRGVVLSLANGRNRLSCVNIINYLVIKIYLLKIINSAYLLQVRCKK